MWRRHKRLVLLVLLLGVTLAAYVRLNCRPEPPAVGSVRRVADLAVAFVGYSTNGAVVQVTNRSSRATYYVASCRIYSRGLVADPEGCLSTEYWLGRMPAILPKTAKNVDLYLEPRTGWWRVELIVADDASLSPADGPLARVGSGVPAAREGLLLSEGTCTGWIKR